MNNPNQTESVNTRKHKDIELSDLLDALWLGRKLIVIITLLVSIASVAYSLTLQDYYKSESILISSDSQSSNSMGQFSGMASLAGITLPSSGNFEVEEMIEIIKSRKFVQHLISFQGVLPAIMAPESFNKITGKLKYDPEIYDEENDLWVRSVSGNRASKPSFLEVHKVYISQLLSIAYDPVSGLVSVKIEHLSPIFAKEFLQLIINEANNKKRESDLKTSSNALAYLRSELENTPFISIRNSINQLIKSQLEIQMTAKINDEYSLKSLEPPFIPEEKSKPSRFFIAIMGFLLGVLLSSLFIILKFIARDNNR